MGKASSSKKVARAARAGGRTSAGQPRSLLFPGVLALVVVLGTALVVYAREDRRNDDLGGVPQLDDHIHQALSVFACGEELPHLPTFDTRIGIHTHADGVIHIHPHSQLGVGANATLGRFVKNVSEEGGIDFTLTDSKLTFQGETFKEGETECEGVDDPQLRLAYWADVQFSDDPPVIKTGDFTDLRLTTNGAGITIYFGDPDADIPKPPHSSDLAALGAVDGGATPGESGTTSSSVPTGDGEDTTTTSAPAGEPSASSGDETTTTAP